MSLTPLRPTDALAVGPYRLLGRLGQGGMGTVYLGVAPDERAVAVKVLRDEIRDPEARRRFGRELQALRSVGGPHLVEVLDADLAAEPPYLVTRFVPGRRLDDVVAQSGPLDPLDLHRLARGVASALAALHSAGLVHRDLTPGNVLLADGQPSVIDLGLAVAADVTALTRSGLVVGTPGYLAPEQVLGRPTTPAVDVHAWGAVVALAATGRPPYGIGRTEAVLYRIVHAAPDLDAVPEPLAGLVAAAMQRDPERRPTAGELVECLGGPSTAPPVTVRLPRDLDAAHVDLTDLTGLSEVDDGEPADLDVDVTQVVPAELTRRLRAEPPSPATPPQAWAVPAAPQPPRTEPTTDRLLVGAGSGSGNLVLPVVPPPPVRAAPPPAPTRQFGPFVPPPGPAPGAPFAGLPPAGPPPAGGPPGGPPAPDGQPALPAAPGWPVEQRLPVIEPPSPARRLQVAATAGAALALLGSVTLVAPLVGIASLLLLLVLLRTLVRSRRALRKRQDRRGSRAGDPVLVLAEAPWHLLCSLGRTLLSLPFLVLVVALPSGAVWVADPFVDGLERLELTAATAVVLGMWAALASRAYRPSRRLLRDTLLAATPGRASGVVVVAVLGALAVLLLAVAEGSSPSLWPLSLQPTN